MSQLGGGAIKWSRLIGTAQQNRRLPSTSFILPKLFSTETAEPSPGFADYQFLHAPPSGSVYGKLANITKYMGKTDAINLLEGSNLRPENLKVEYSRAYIPLSMMVEFPSLSSYNTALRTIGKKGRLYSLQRADKAVWDTIAPYDGKAIVLIGIPPAALAEDVERFLSGCQYISSSLSIFVRSTNQGPVRMGLVQFSSQTLAMHAYITKNSGFILNSQISIQVLY